jgi:hypothetical protein
MSFPTVTCHRPAAHPACRSNLDLCIFNVRHERAFAGIAPQRPARLPGRFRMGKFRDAPLQRLLTIARLWALSFGGMGSAMRQMFGDSFLSLNSRRNRSPRARAFGATVRRRRVERATAPASGSGAVQCVVIAATRLGYCPLFSGFSKNSPIIFLTQSRRVARSRRP